jgi:hypothetical protein
MATVNDTEPNNNHFQANSFNLGDTIVGSLSSSTDWDFYKVTLGSDGIIKLDVSTPQLSNWAYTVKVYDASTSVLATDYFGYVSSGSFSIGAAAGTYYIGVTSNNLYSSSPYTIVTSAGAGNIADYEKEPNDTKATATAVSLDHVITGQRSSGGDVDYFSVNTNSAGTLSIDFQAPKKYGYADYQVSIYDASGNLIDSRTGNGNMTIVDQVGAAGKYYVRVEQAQDGGYLGSDYKFMAHVDAAPAAAATSTLTNAVPASGTIASASQHNWYKVSLTAGSMYEFSASGSGSGGGTLSTPSLTLCAADGHALEYCTNLPTYSSGTVYTADPQIAFVAPYSGTYYLMVDGLGATGSYTVQQQTDTLASMIPDLLRTSSAGNYLHWGSGTVGVGATVTYGFMTTSSIATSDGETGFKAMTDSQKQAVRDVLALYHSFANINFVEVSDPNAANILYGTSNQAGISSGVTYTDWNSGGILDAADVFINNTASSSAAFASSDSMYAGGFGYETLIHETGHALGLKHPGNYNSVSGSGMAPFIASAWDNIEYSIMSYLDNPEYEVSAQSPALLDIAAIQYLYGPRSSVSGKTLSFTAGGEFKQSVLADTGAVTLDFSNQTVGNIISATPGTFSSVGLKTDGTHAHDNLALPFGVNVVSVVGGSGGDYIFGGSASSVYGGAGDDTIFAGSKSETLDGGSGNDTIVLPAGRSNFTVVKSGAGYTIIDDSGSGSTFALSNIESARFSDSSSLLANDASVGQVYAGTAANDVLQGGTGDDVLNGNDGNDLIKPGAGNNIVDGGAGFDTVLLSGAFGNFTVTKTSTGFTLADKTGALGKDVLTNVERVVFNDAGLAFDTDGNAGKMYRLYQAAFDRQPDLAGLGWQIKAVDGGTSFLQIAQAFMDSAEFKSLYGDNLSSTGLVSALYHNVLHRTPQQFEVDFWTKIIDTGQQTRADVLTNFSESAENQAQVIGSIQNGIEYTYFA